MILLYRTKINWKNIPNMSSSSSSTEHSTETIRKTGGKDKNYAKSLIKRYAEIVEYYLENKVEKGFDTVFKQTRVTSGGVKWEIHPTKWNKMMETDNDSKNVLFQYVSDKRASYWDEKKSGMSHFGLVSTSIKTQMKKQQIHYSYQAEEMLTDYYKCLRKSDARHSQEEGIDDHAKVSIPFYVYEEVAKDLLSSGEIIWWAFMILQWNLMARSINVEQIHVEFFGWSGDMMTCLFAHTKTLKGDRTKMKPFHLSTNQQRPWICPVTAVAILLMSGFHSTKQLFEAGSAAKSYNKAIKKALKSPSVQTAMKRAGVSEKDVASHTLRKSSATHVSGNSLCAPSIFSILLRGGWSIGEVMQRYIHVGEAQDRFLAHLLAGRDLFETSFHYVCPHFITLPSEEILKGTLFIIIQIFCFFLFLFH